MACEVTLQPIDRFELDAAILFSDILTIPDAMGLGLSFAEGEGPRFAHPLRTLEAIEREHILRVIARSPSDVQPVLDAVVKSASRLFAPCDATIVLRDGDQIIWRAHAAH